MVRLTDHLNMTLDVYRGCKTTQQQQQPSIHVSVTNGVSSITVKSFKIFSECLVKMLSII